MPGLDTVKEIAQLVEDHGVLLVLSILLGALTIYHLALIYRGKLVPVAIYKEMKDENERLKRVMEKEREESMRQVLNFMGGLKKVDNHPTTQPGEEGVNDGDNSR